MKKALMKPQRLPPYLLVPLTEHLCMFKDLVSVMLCDNLTFQKGLFILYSCSVTVLLVVHFLSVFYLTTHLLLFELYSNPL